MQLPKSMKLQPSGAVHSRHSRKVVFRYHKPNINAHPGKYSHSFTNENDLTLDGSYTVKLSGENVLEIVNQKKQKFKPNGDLINNYFHQLH